MAIKNNKDVSIWFTEPDLQNKDEKIEMGKEFPVKPNWGPIQSPIFPPCPFTDAIPVYAGPDDKAYQIVGEKLFVNGQPFGKLDDSWTFVNGQVTTDMNSILNPVSAKLDDKQAYRSATTPEKKGNSGTSKPSATAATKDNKIKSEIKARTKFLMPRCSRSSIIISCCQILTISLILVLVYLPVHFDLLAWPPVNDNSDELEHSSLEMDVNFDLEKELEMALSFKTSAAQDRLEWEIDNSPGIPIEHLDHREYQLGNRVFIEHHLFPDMELDD